MATITKFEDLEAWQLCRELCGKVFDYTNITAFSKDYALKDQINRSSGSAMDNIAEGFGRGSRNEFVNFLSFACGSLTEVKSQLHRRSTETTSHNRNLMKHTNWLTRLTIKQVALYSI